VRPPFPVSVTLQIVRKHAGTLVSALLSLLACTVPTAYGAEGSVSYGSCPETNDFACGHLTVPLDWSGHTPGTITLSIRRHRAPLESSRRVAVIGLAGGPGQAAIPFASDFSQQLGPILSTRDLIVFDQRGTGSSHPLSCHAFELHQRISPGLQVADCAKEIGPERAFYTTASTVNDIEAIRQAGGYEKLVLYGTSFGTKVAERYAQEYPQYVEALVLDSVVQPNGPEQLQRHTMTAVARVLRQLCSFRACKHITSNPVGDLSRLLKRLRRSPLHGRYINQEGTAHTLRITSNELLDILVAGDLEPALRSEFPAAVHSALQGDTAPMARMLARASGEPESSSEDIDLPLYYASTCEEETFPWRRGSSPAVRLREARAQLRALGHRAFAPFDMANAFDLSDMPTCAYWPFASGAPEIDDAPLPDVPTLILSGADDLRTPTANAREVARAIPGSHLLVVPNTGHSVLGSDPSSCSENALQAFFAQKQIRQCQRGPLPAFLRPIALAPRRLSSVPSAHGYHGLAGRTLQAVSLTLGDFSRQLALKEVEALGEGALSLGLSVDVGGLRSGWASESATGLSFHHYSYVPGVAISGQIALGSAVLKVGGSAAATGVLHLGPKEKLTGTLGGVAVHVSDFNPQSAQAAQASVASLRTHG
jgi:pimeloyl-ACP methyl ester carboxylesterase